MFTLRINCRDDREANRTVEKICEAIQGTKAFIDNDVIVPNANGEIVEVIIGESNDKDYTMEFTSRY